MSKRRRDGKRKQLPVGIIVAGIMPYCGIVGRAGYPMTEGLVG